MSEPAFHHAINEDAMATEKLAQGIRDCTRALRTLRELAAARLAV